MAGMVTNIAYLLAAIAAALLIAIAFKPNAIGWLIAGVGVLFLTHAGVTLAIIWANDNVVPTYVSFWQLFATIPVGLVLLTLGLGIACIRSCAARLRAQRKVVQQRNE
jgi:hypothetical protein